MLRKKAFSSSEVREIIFRVPEDGNASDDPDFSSEEGELRYSESDPSDSEMSDCVTNTEHAENEFSRPIIGNTRSNMNAGD